jgi:ribonuclease P protein component
MRRSADFTAAVRNGRRVRRGTLVVHIHSREDTRGPLVGLIVGSSVGGSVVRHRVSRRLRAITRARLGRMPSDSRIVLRALPAAGAASSAQLAADLDAALDRLTSDRALARTAARGVASDGVTR